ncbi:hypothetical protein, partial [Zarconia navalis]|uniref:hypothetical protein n=1 Tax=Zarconia navalis TaxID=2992134 RepID=UPI0021F89FEE
GETPARAGFSVDYYKVDKVNIAVINLLKYRVSGFREWEMGNGHFDRLSNQEWGIGNRIWVYLTRLRIAIPP